jgi:hypothetical protein
MQSTEIVEKMEKTAIEAPKTVAYDTDTLLEKMKGSIFS